MSATAHPRPAAEGHLLVVSDGRYDALASDAVDGLAVSALSDGLRLHVRPGLELEAPLVVDVQGAGGRIRLEAGARCRLTIIERNPDADSVAELALAPGATVRHLRVGPGRLDARLEAGAAYALQSFALGAGTFELAVTLAGEGAEARLDGLDALIGDERAVTRASIVHAAPATRSRQRHRILASGRAQSTFFGRIQVDRGAAGTDAAQSSRALLLAQGPTVEARPELAIFEDDVKCAHGAAIGQLDADALFYLLSRGLTERQARAALVEAFAAEVLAEVAEPAWRGALTAALIRRLAGREAVC